MEKDAKNTTLDYVLNNGNTVKLTLTFGKLNVLKSVNNQLYEKFNKIVNGKSDEILDLVTIIYVAYWCANFGKDGILTESEFIDLVPFDLLDIKKVFTTLTQPKKK